MSSDAIVTGVMSALPEIVAHTEGGKAPEWIQIVPAGTFKGVDGRGPYHLHNAAQVISASLPDGGRPLPLDYNHATVMAAKSGGEAPAAGWIVELQSREDGIWGRVEWTPAGEKAVEGKEYRFLSPAFATDTKGNVTRIVNTSLTNLPNIRELASLHTAGAPDETETLLAGIREDMAAIRLMTVRPAASDQDKQDGEQEALRKTIRAQLGLT